MDHKQCSRLRLLAAGLFAACSFVASSAFADLAAAKQDVKEIMGLDGISWEAPHNYSAANLVVSGPGGFRMEQAFKLGEPLFLDFAKVADKAGPNGQFKYQLVFSPKVSARDKALAAEARALGEDVGFLAAQAPASRTGAFTLADGHPVDIDLPETTLKDFVINDDLIVDGSACIGFDCINGEVFGFDTLKLKENNLRIKADDTSNSASFPNFDWQITFNDSSNGGLNKFSIDQVGPSARTPFTIEGNAPNHSLYVDDGGRIGLGTNTPVVELHIVDGDTPTLRLEQDGSSGFTAQIWDVAGNETNFFVRDVTNGSLLPFRIRPQAPSNSIFVNTNGDVGFGTSSPTGAVHVSRSGVVVPTFQSSNNMAVQFRIQSNLNGNRRIVALNGMGGVESQINMNNGGNISFLGTGNSDGVCLDFRDSDDSGNITRCTFLAGAISCAVGACP